MMDTEINFHEHKFENSLLGDLRRARAVSEVTQNLLEAIFRHGGYIAGGFGTVIARRVISGIFPREPKHIDSFDLWDAVRKHLRYPEFKPVGAPTWHNSGCGDIDIWFPDNDALKAFLNDKVRLSYIRTGQITSAHTATKTAIEHIVQRDARIQVITRYLMPMNEQIKNFDIYNGMIAVTNDKIVYPEHFVTLESQKMLHVVNWESPWTVNRFFKWMSRKEYESVTPATAQMLVKKAVEMYEQSNDIIASYRDKSESDVTYDLSKDKLKKLAVFNPGYVQKFLRYTMSNLNSEQLLQLSTYFKPSHPEYDYALREVYKRAKPYK